MRHFGLSDVEIIARAAAEKRQADLDWREACDKARFSFGFEAALRASMGLATDVATPLYEVVRLDAAGAEVRVHLDGQGPDSVDAEVLRRKLADSWAVCKTVEVVEDSQFPSHSIIRLTRLNAGDPPSRGVAL